ncbi:MAG: glycosyltransferase [Clostridia bacterium]|nr:glycosyltransferase [Clostridia bacterium]
MISVIMPVHNAGRYIRQAITSILEQTEKELELIIVNDGSTDNSEEIIFSIEDQRIKYFKQEKAGAASARNFGIDMAKGSFIALQDADDISLPGRLEILKRQFICESVGLVHSDVMLIDENDSPIGYFVNRNIERKRAVRYFFKTGTPVCGGSMMVRREVFKNLRYDKTLIIGEDNDLLLQICRDWVTVHVPEPLYLYRRNYSSTSYRAYDYTTYYSYIRKILRVYSLEELFPEIGWNKEEDLDCQAKALAIASVIMFRRGLVNEAKELILSAFALVETGKSVNNQNTRKFLLGTFSLLTGNYDGAILIYNSCGNTDHLIENYLGECYALKGDIGEAQRHFLKALVIHADYDDAIDNLRAIAGKTSEYCMGDNTWQKFHRMYNVNQMKSMLEQ